MGPFTSEIDVLARHGVTNQQFSIKAQIITIVRVGGRT